MKTGVSYVETNIPQLKQPSARGQEDRKEAARLWFIINYHHLLVWKRLEKAYRKHIW